MAIRKFFILFCFLTFGYNSYSQPFVDIINIRYQHFPGVKYVSDKTKMMTIDEYTYSFTLPIERKNKDVIIAGALFDQLKFSSSIFESKKYLYGINLQLGYLHYWKESKWKTLLICLPKISADKIILSSSTFQLGGVIVFHYQKKENFAYKFGLYYNSEYFGNFFMPLAGIEWRPIEKINIYGLLPGSFNIEYKLKKNLYVGLSYYNLTQSYRVYGTNYFVRNGDRFWGNMHYKGYINYHIRKYLLVFGEVGYTFGRRYEEYKNSTELTNDPFFSKTQNGPLINFGLSFRVRTDTKKS